LPLGYFVLHWLLSLHLIMGDQLRWLLRPQLAARDQLEQESKPSADFELRAHLERFSPSLASVTACSRGFS
jgi:hypothetical protein